MSSDVKFLVITRKYIRTQVTKIYGDKDNFHNLNSFEISTLTIKLKSFQQELSKLNDKIAILKWNETKEEKELEKELASNQLYDERIIESLSLLTVPVTSINFARSNEIPRSLLKCPTAPLPKFTSADGENLEQFFRQFEDTTAKFSYTDYDKLLLLKQQVSGKAFILIDSLEADRQAYSHAKSLLITALASPTVQKFNILKQLSEMKLNYDSEPFQYIGNIRKIQEATKTLKIGLDDVLQFFFWTGLNDTFKNQLIQITNHTRPSLKEIIDNFFDANERYATVVKGFKNRRSNLEYNNKSKENFIEIQKRTTSLATNINLKTESYKSNPFNNCTICSDEGSKEASHPIHKCDKYKSSKEKIEKLKILRACTKCATLEHETDSCRFRFTKRCYYCRGWHFSFLCVANANEKQNSSEVGKKCNSNVKFKINEGTKKETQNGMVWLGTTLQSKGGIDSILPTFSCHLENEKMIRCLRDCGSQTTFISERLVKEQKLKTIEDHVQLKVNGFNSSKTYYTKVVEVKLKLNDEYHTLEAMCIPNIDIKLNLPGLTKIVNKFSDLGYTLADKFLLKGDDKIENIDLILGSNSAYCIKDTTVRFGEVIPSIYSDTQLGVMLIGNIKGILDNLNYISHNNDISQTLCSVVEEAGSSEENISCQNLAFSMTSCTNSSTGSDEFLEAAVNFCVLNESGNVDETELNKATSQILNQRCCNYVDNNDVFPDENSIEINDKLVKFALQHTTRDDTGRLTMPLLWNGKVAHLLGKNENLARQILKANKKKLLKKPDYFKMMDDNIKEQESQGIIEKISNLDQFLEEHPEHSFLPHMGVFKPGHETSKCRMVFLSNLSEKNGSGSQTISHNQAMWPGPCINQKLSIALLLLRFDEKLLCFDLKKAFLQIALNEIDKNKLMFLWFNNVEKGDFEVVAYRNLRLSFGLRCSPTILMIALFKILMVDSDDNSSELRNLKKLVYSLMYMDNGAVTMNNSKNLKRAYDSLPGMFDPYKFELQQYITNDKNLQEEIDKTFGKKTPTQVKLFGLNWDREDDTLSTKKLNLEVLANTKRLILQSIASNFDPYNYNGPILNRARIFMHKLQIDKSLDWDTKLNSELIREWKNITKQVNNTPEIKIKRFIGRRNGSYRLIAFTDSSKLIYGTVIFIQNTDNKEISFILAKNRIVNSQLEIKGTPSLEFQGIILGTQTLIDIWKDLTGPQCVKPINIVELQLYTDSLVSLSWINCYINKLDKMNKKSVFIMNRLNQLQRLCEQFPIRYSFVSGFENPSDCITRSVSYRQLMKTNYFTGPEFTKSLGTSKNELSRGDIMNVLVPNPLAIDGDAIPQTFVNFEVSSDLLAKETDEQIVSVDRYSSFRRLIGVHKMVLMFINKLKSKLKIKDPEKYEYLVDEEDLYVKANRQVIRSEQKIKFPEIYQYFNRKEKNIKDIPNLVNQLNIFIDQEGILRVKSKFSRWKNDKCCRYPILLHKESRLTYLIINDLHQKFSHIGVYSLLAEMRKKFWIPHYYSVVKKILRDCISCRRFKERTIKLNQSPYREFRLDPPNIPYQYIFIDHLGPYHVKVNGQKVKVWLLCLTCLWSRAINLKLCMNLTTQEFLRAFQLHSFEYGIPQLVLSDLGSQLVAGANIISDFLKDHEAQSYFEENNVKPIKFEQYFKGCNKLGSLVESCVKATKRLIYGSIRNNVLECREFEFIVGQTVHLINRRPVAFKDGLRDNSGEYVPDPITPESLIHGHNLVSLNMIPYLQSDPEPDPYLISSEDPVSLIKNSFSKLKKVRSKLIESYNSEFVGQLIDQAVNSPGRYKPVKHKKLQKGDIVLLKEINVKPVNYPMGVVIEVQTNILEEVTGVLVLKGKTREKVKRHVSSVIPLLRLEELGQASQNILQSKLEVQNEKEIFVQKKMRNAAIIGQAKIKQIIADEL